MIIIIFKRLRVSDHACIYLFLKNMLCKMTIHDEIIKEITKPNEQGKTILDDMISFPIRNIELEAYRRVVNPEGEFEKICPDIIVDVEYEGRNQLAIEVESDITWDFASSLRQVKKYRRNQSIRFLDVKAIIPKDYEEYAPLYRNEDIDVWTWQALSHWICYGCDTRQAVHLQRPRIVRRCENEEKHEHHLRLEFLSDVKIEVAKFESNKVAHYLR